MPAIDNFSSTRGPGETPAENAVAVAPNDTNELTHVTTALYIGGAGNVTVRMHGGGTVTFAAVPAGTQLRIRAKGVNATGTTATNIVALY